MDLSSAASAGSAAAVAAPRSNWRDKTWWTGQMHDDDTPRWLMLAARAMPLLVLLNAIIASSRAYLSPKPWLVFFEDDFYYYLKVAQNLAHGSGSTFNGIVQTNGYHPLWLLTLTVFSLFTSKPHAIFWFVALVSMVSAIVTFYLAREIFNQSGANYVMRQMLAAYIAIYSLHIFYTGMEVILAVPLVFLAMVVVSRRNFWQRGFWQSSVLGLILSAMVLARLDLIILVGLMFFWVLVNREMRRSITATQIAGIAVGLLPLALYFLSNYHFFGTWLPVSGMAKQVKFNHLPTLRPWRTVYSHNVNNLLNLLPIHLAILTLPLVWKRLTAAQRVLFPSVLLFPFVYVFILSCLSDWQLWLWYMYPTRAALCASFVIFSLWGRTGSILRTRLFAAFVLAVVAGELVTAKWWTRGQESIYYGAADVQAFAATHPGTYAMGDRSGILAYLIPYPIVQTEGLVMDRGYIDRIRGQQPLLEALKEFHVKYYVGTSWKPYTGCFHAVEPFQAGKTSAHMEAYFCSKPLATFDHEDKRTLIFDLDKEATLTNPAR